MKIEGLQASLTLPKLQTTVDVEVFGALNLI